MKKQLLLSLIALLLLSCQKENIIDGEQLPINQFEDLNITPFTVSGTQVNCNLIYLNIEIKDEVLPKDFQYTHFLIEDPFANIIKTTKQRFIYVSAICNDLSEYKVHLHNEEDGKSSKTHLFTFQTKP
ncbi:MAG: hypothetical protein JKY48_12380 [Flavobacteriales bacterium]|nr:hypothetical protein [Flavobacteriales bacterium]